MKILTFVDMHGSLKDLKKLEKKAKKVDLIICAGDISMFSDKLFYFMQQIDSFGKPVMIVHGNHESSEEMKGLAKMLNNTRFIHNTVFQVSKDCVIFGWGGGGFALRDRKFEKSAKNKFKKYCNKKYKTILLTHAPPYGTKLDIVYYEHVGSKSIFEFIYKNKPTYVVCGHIHDCGKRRDVINGVPVLNTGGDGVIIEV
tara:strand:+ start:553 stop:1149 length:597 start_codon:yes stop_codon:yes gene_type:complete